MYFLARTDFGKWIAVPLRWIKGLRIETVYYLGARLSKKTYQIYYSQNYEIHPDFMARFAISANDDDCCFLGQIFDASGKFNTLCIALIQLLFNCALFLLSFAKLHIEPRGKKKWAKCPNK